MMVLKPHTDGAPAQQLSLGSAMWLTMSGWDQSVPPSGTIILAAESWVRTYGDREYWRRSYAGDEPWGKTDPSREHWRAP